MKLHRDLNEIELELDEELYGRIVEDMERSAGIHAPAKVWHMESLFPDSPESRARPPFSDMVEQWIGRFGKPASAEEVRATRAFLRKAAGRAGLPSTLDRAMRGASRGSGIELRTIHDIALMTSRLPRERLSGLRILEVGPGYGRLAEGFFKLGMNARFVLVDAVPASLYYTYAYLRQELPKQAVGLYYLDGPEQAEDFDCYIVPTWRLKECAFHPFDLAVNIASFQEMKARQVDYYLRFFDRNVADGGQIYLSNSRDYPYPREYSYPASWKLLFKESTPFSVTDDYPVEIFERTSGDWTLANRALEADYFRELYERASQERSSLRDVVPELRLKAKNWDACSGELPGLRFKAGRADELASQVDELKIKGKKYDRLAAELEQLDLVADPLYRLRNEVKRLRFRAQEYEANRRELPKLKAMRARLEELEGEAAELRDRSSAFDRLLKVLADMELPSDARELRRAINTLKRHSREREGFLAELKETRYKAKLADELQETAREHARLLNFLSRLGLETDLASLRSSLPALKRQAEAGREPKANEGPADRPETDRRGASSARRR